MTLVVAASAHGSPGVSTAVQLTASLWPLGDVVPVVVETDASGGVLAARYELALTPGFVTLAESLRKHETPELLEHAQRMPSGVACVPLSPSATAASAQLRSAAPFLGSYLSAAPQPVLLDVGTLLPDSKVIPAVTEADLLLWFVRPTREELLVLRHRLAECPQPDNVGVVLVGDRPYDADQVAEGLGVKVLHTLPLDERAAAATNLGGDDRFLRRSPLARSCSQLAAIMISESEAGRSLKPPTIDLRDREPVDDGITVWRLDDDDTTRPPPPPPPPDPALVVWVNDSDRP